MIREILVHPQETVWQPWIVAYFFFIGIGFSAVFSALWIFLKQGRLGLKEETLALAVASVCVLVGSLALLGDLHQPGRIIHFYTDFNAGSWMAWGAFFLPWFCISVIAYFVSLVVAQIAERDLPRPLLGFSAVIRHRKGLLMSLRLSSAVSALMIVLYTLMETYATGTRPLWRSYWLLPIMLCSVLPFALALIAVLTKTFTKNTALYRFKRPILLHLIILVLAVAAWYLESADNSRDLDLILQNAYSPYVLMLAFIIALAANFYGRDKIALLALAVLAWTVRWVLVIEVQSLSKTNVLQNFYHFDWLSTEGGIGMLSLFGLCLCLALLMHRLMVFIFKGGVQHG
ncbi:tetrathionate reductase gamma subunit [Mesocricetibacter intestinalis]|uniref:Tetrathionate reductase gamma subunit n=1 Tax=Mesocricetibacter intestinalis TaxID=1521930 RepID=A0A4R6V8D8_9PAST|nr:NrfD/PsrC family molybdoenzyme membrane anchor subunit [Mesocricetibacter intestinalis]TDQ57962.1 tetrathionate reductase gamma subunit [Mesocricetibacter intestinalis]